MARTKYTNDILKHEKNGGLHSRRKLNTLQQVFTTHDLKDAIAYQFILSGSTKDEYQATMKAIMRHIRTKCRAEYIGAYEVGDEKGGIHAHAFVIVETAKHFPSDLLDVTEGGFIARRIKRRKLSIRIEPPKNRMHGGQMFARMNTPDKLADCIKWATYFLKVRSKSDVPGRETYFGSEFTSNIAKREAQRQKYRDALMSTPAAPAAPQPNESEQHETRTTEAPEASSTDNSQSLGSTTEFKQRTGTAPLAPDRSRSEAGSPAGPASSPAPADHADDANEACHPLDGSEAIRQDGSGRTSPYRSGGTGGQMTPATRYIASLYEQAVDADMDIDEVRKYLFTQGVLRTPGMVAYELENTYGFIGYANKHPAKPTMDVRAYDKAIDKGKSPATLLTEGPGSSVVGLWS
ncbi:hypothetical protein ACEN88_12510 [Massilia sp. CT11-108]|uniref:hypothetical protein n=1 Tax=Massilia sp. CT11-108 TaxID=3393900 RepID=UPI0039A6EF4A